MAILSRAVRNARAMMRSAEWGDSSIPPNSMAGPGLGQGFGGSSSSLEASALAISTVMACVKVLHDDVTILPFAAYQGDPHGPRRVSANQPPIITQPFGPDLSPAAGFGQIVVSKSMRGNAYLFVTARDRNEYPVQLAVLHPDKVTPGRDLKSRKCFKIGTETYYSEDVIHITGLMPPNAVAGVDVLTAQRVNFDLAKKVGAYAEGFFDQGNSPGGVVSVPGPGDRKKAREVKQNFEAGHSGVANAHNVAVMFGGATWTPMSITPENAQFLQTRRFLREEICGLFGVPMQRIQAIVENASQGGGKGLDAIDHGYVTHTILPLLTGIEAAWNQMLPGGTSTWTSFDVDGFLRAAAHERAQIALIHRTIAARVIDEIRGDEGWEPLPNGQGQNPFTPLNSNVALETGVPTSDTPADGGQGGKP